MNTPSSSLAAIDAILEAARIPAASQDHISGPGGRPSDIAPPLSPLEGKQAGPEYLPRTTHAQKVEYTHERLIDMILLNPQLTNVELGRAFGVSGQHIGFLRSSDAFQSRLSLRRDQDILPAVQEELNARMRSVANRSLQVLAEKLEQPSANISDALVLKAVELGARGVGLGGFGSAPASPPAPAADRIEKLAERLTQLMPDRKQGAVDVEAREIPSAT